MDKPEHRPRGNNRYYPVQEVSAVYPLSSSALWTVFLVRLFHDDPLELLADGVPIFACKVVGPRRKIEAMFVHFVPPFRANIRNIAILVSDSPPWIAADVGWWLA